jgi:hypothetical protein
MGCCQVLAATLDFSSVRSGTRNTPIVFPTVAISESSGGALFVYDGKGGTGQVAGPQVCGLQSGFTCTGGVSLLFVGPVSDLKFNGYFATESDRATVSAYADDTLISFILLSGNPNGRVAIDFTGVSGITRVEIDDLSSGISKGIAYGDFDYTVDPPGPPAPLPSPLGLSFDVLTAGVNAAEVDLGVARLKTDSGNLFVYRSGDFGMAPNGGFCAYTTSKDCMGDFILDFKLPVFDLTFAGYFAKLTDGAIISLFDGDVMIYTGRHTGNTAGTIRFDFSQFASVTRVVIQDDSNPQTRGIAYGSFRFLEVTAVPLPAPAFLLLAALGLLALSAASRRRRENLRLIDVRQGT